MKNKVMRSRVPSKRLSRKIETIISGSSDWEEVYECMRKNNMTTRVRTSDYKKRMISKISKMLIDMDMSQDQVHNELKIDFENSIHDIWYNLFGRESKKSWTGLKRATGYSMKLKSAGIPLEGLRDANGDTVYGDMMNRLIIKDYSEKHYKDRSESMKHEFPIIPLDSIDPSYLSIGLPNNKALSYDCISDVSLRLCHSLFVEQGVCRRCINIKTIITYVFTISFWKNSSSQVHLKARLIPLSKDNDSIGLVSNYRPIVAVSPIIKLLENYIFDELREYCKHNIHDRQIGFMQGFDRHAHIHALRKRITTSEKGYTLYIDISSAYDSVRRNILYDMMRRRGVLSNHKFNILVYIHSNIQVGIGRRCTYTDIGVPQGLKTSPLLFNIYIDDVICTIHNDGT